MQHTSQISILDTCVQADWQKLMSDWMGDGEELLPRFAAYYTHLQTLPRRMRRALQRQWRMPLAGVALMLALGQSPALAATIQVGGACTLVDAITAANTDTATGGCPAGSGADTIVLPPGSTHTLTAINHNIYGHTGLPVISSAITIAGQGSTILRASEAPDFRLFAVRHTGDLTLQETTISGGVVSPDGFLQGGGVFNYNGTVTVTNSIISGNSAVLPGLYGGSGGGLSNRGTFTVMNSTITGNTAGFGGGGVRNQGLLVIINSTIADNSSTHASDGFAAGGGGLHNQDLGTVTVTNSTISGNFSRVRGGGVNNYGDGATLTVTNSTISGNSAYFGGGGVQSGGTVTLTNSTISGNSAVRYGGGVRNSGTLTLLNSTISGNSAYFGGGGVENDRYNTITLLNSTISGNTVHSFDGDGGGVSNNYGTLTVTNSTISGNSAGDNGGGVSNFFGTVTLVRTLVSGNTGITGPEISSYGTGGTVVVADNHNLFGVNGMAGVVGFSPGTADLVPSAGVQLGNILNPVLAFNGGPTQTHTLVPTSPAIDAGGLACTDATGNPLLTDQRGKPRIIDGNGDGTARCDIGAFEFFPVVNNLVILDPALDTSFNPTPVPNAPAGTFTIGAVFTNTSGTLLRFPFFTVTELSGDNVLLNAEERPRGVGATVTPNVGDQVLSPGETVQVDFLIGLQTSTPFTFFVDLFAEPLVSGASISRHRPNATTKGGRR